MSDALSTVVKAMRVLDYLAERESPAPIKSVAADLSINLSSAYHLMNTLASGGYVARDQTSAYALGPKAGKLGDAYRHAWPVRPQLREILRRLNRQTDENAYLALLHGADVVIAEILESQQRVRIASLYPGYSEDLHARALGKAVLAHLPVDRVRAHFAARPPRQCTARTRCELAAIEHELARVRRRGYSEDLEEYSEGVCCVGAPFFGEDGQVKGALSVSIPAFRFGAARLSARAAIVGAATAATAAMKPEVQAANVG